MEVLEGKIERLIASVKSTYPNTPLKILSPLAEGADRLVAKVGFRMGLGLICPLPLPLEEYKKDFQSPESLRDFVSLLGQAEYHFVLPQISSGVQDEQRNSQYAAVGAYIAMHSQILLALWNGRDTGELGGTASVVQYKLYEVPLPYSKPIKALDVQETGPVYHIFTPRKNKDSLVTVNNHQPETGICLVDVKQDWDVLYPRNWKIKNIPANVAQEYYHKILADIEAYNRDVQERQADSLFRAAIGQSKGYLYPDDKQGVLDTGLKDLLEVQGCADQLAIGNQILTFRALKILPVAAVLAFFFLSFFDEIWSVTAVLLLFPLTLAAGFMLSLSVATKGYENKYHDYRVFAEGLRVQFYWKLGGIGDNVYEHYQRKYRGEIEWIAHAIRNVSIRANLKTDDRSHAERVAAFESIRSLWIEDQRTFFEKNIVRKKDIPHKQEKITKAFFVAAALFVIGIFALKAYVMLHEGSWKNILAMEDVKEIKLYSIFLVFVDVCFAVGAAFQVYVEKRAFVEEVKQYQRMADLFSRGSSKLQECLAGGRVADIESLLIDIGDEALIENGDWLLLKRSRPLEMPIG